MCLCEGATSSYVFGFVLVWSKSNYIFSFFFLKREIPKFSKFNLCEAFDFKLFAIRRRTKSLLVKSSFSSISSQFDVASFVSKYFLSSFLNCDKSETREFRPISLEITN